MFKYSNVQDFSNVTVSKYQRLCLCLTWYGLFSLCFFLLITSLCNELYIFSPHYRFNNLWRIMRRRCFQNKVVGNCNMFFIIFSLIITFLQVFIYLLLRSICFLTLSYLLLFDFVTNFTVIDSELKILKNFKKFVKAAKNFDCS